MERELSIVVPCYNEEKNIPAINEHLSRTFFGIDYEIIFVDDGSCDGTWDTIRNISGNKGSKIKAIRFSRNFGKEAAVFAGLSNCVGEYTILIDADLQQSPEVARDMLEMLIKNPDLDMVTAYQDRRSENKVMSKTKSLFYKMINRLSEVDFVNGASDFRVFNKKVRNALLEMTEYHRFSKGLFSWVGFNTEFIPYKADERKNGETKWSAKKLIKYAIDGIVSFSVKPLKWSVFTGFMCGLGAMLYMLCVIIQKLFFGIEISGYATIVVLLLLIGGIQMIFIGIIGEYISKIFIQSKNRPIYIERDCINIEQI